MGLRYINIPDEFADELPVEYFEKLALTEAEKIARARFATIEKQLKLTNQNGFPLIKADHIEPQQVQQAIEAVEKALSALRDLKRMAMSISYTRDRLYPAPKDPKPEDPFEADLLVGAQEVPE